MTVHALILATNVPFWASRASQGRDSCSAGHQVADPSGNRTASVRHGLTLFASMVAPKSTDDY